MTSSDGERSTAGEPDVCSACGGALEIFPVFHHMICAYVGPQYDFVPNGAGFICPKCRRDIVPGDDTCEIVVTSARCVRCSKEMVMPPQQTPQHA